MLAALEPGVPLTSSDLAARFREVSLQSSKIYFSFQHSLSHSLLGKWYLPRWGCEHQKVVGAVKSLLALPQQMVLAELSSVKR